MGHPFFDAPTFPWHHPDAVPAQQALLAAYPQFGPIDTLYQRCAPRLAPLSMYDRPEKLWKDALEALAAAGAIRRLCELVLADSTAATAHGAIRRVVAATDDIVSVPCSPGHGRLTTQLSDPASDASSMPNAAEGALERSKSLFGPDGMLPESATSVPLFPELVEGIELRWASAIREFVYEYDKAPFGGRDAELAELDEWFGDATTRLGLLVAGAGRGKSALLVSWIRRVAKAGLADVIFMPVSLRFRTARVSAVARSIARRLLRVLPPRKHAAPPDDPADALRECKEVFRASWPGTRPLLIVIDGLDEAIDWDYRELIPDVAGKNVKLLVAARQLSTSHADWEELLGWTNCTHLVLRPLTPSSVAGIVASVGEFRELARDASLMERFCTLTEGDPLIVQLYLSLLRSARQDSPVERMEALLREQPSIGDPLNKFFDIWWKEQRLQWGDQSEAEGARIQKVLHLLAFAKGPLGLADLRELIECDPETLRRTLEHLRRFVIVDRTADRYVFSHSRLQAYFSDSVLKADDQERWQRQFVAFGNSRLARLEADSARLNSQQFERRFGYVIRHHALHLQEVAPADLVKLLSHSWLEGWKALDDEDGVYGGFYEDVRRVENWARTEGTTGEHVRALLIEASITSLSSNVLPGLMRRLVESKRWPLSRALRLIDRLVDEDERESALAALTRGVEGAEQREVLHRAMALPRGNRSRALAAMMPLLAEPLRRPVLDKLLADELLLQRYSYIDLDQLIESLNRELVLDVLERGRSLSDPDQRAYVLLAIAASARALSREERRIALEECRASALSLTDVAQRAHQLCDMAAAAVECAPDMRGPLLQHAWNEVRTLRHDVQSERETAHHILCILLDNLDAMSPSTQQEIEEEAWRSIEASDLAWLALSRVGPRLARRGFTSRVLKYHDSILSDDHNRGLLLGSILPYAGELSCEVMERLRQLKNRYLALGPLAQHLHLLTPHQKSVYLEEVFELVSWRPNHSHLLDWIASRIQRDDPHAPKLLATARRLEEPDTRSQRLVECLHLVPDSERGPLVKEILRDARAITILELKKRLWAQLIHSAGTDEELLPPILEESRRINDEGLLAYAVERIASMLAEDGHIDDATILAERVASTFNQHPHWAIETYIAILSSLARSDARDHLWKNAVRLASALQVGATRAVLLASLAQTAPVELAQQHISTVHGEIEALTDPFHKVFTRVRLLDGLDPNTMREGEIEIVIAALTNGMPRFESFRLIQDLLARLRPAERDLHREPLDAALTELLHYRRQPDGATRVSEKHQDHLDRLEIIDKLTPFLSLAQTRDILAKTSPSSVSNIESLAVRLAELGQHTEAIEAARKVESPDNRSKNLARLLEHLPGPERVAVVAEVQQHLGRQRDLRQAAETASFLAPHLLEPERRRCICSALVNACAIRPSGGRRETMHRLARSAVVHLAPDQLAHLWAELLDRIAKQRREGLVADLVSLTPMALRVGGPKSARRIGETLLDVANWFP